MNARKCWKEVKRKRKKEIRNRRGRREIFIVRKGTVEWIRKQREAEKGKER